MALSQAFALPVAQPARPSHSETAARGRGFGCAEMASGLSATVAALGLRRMQRSRVAVAAVKSKKKKQKNTKALTAALQAMEALEQVQAQEQKKKQNGRTPEQDSKAVPLNKAGDAATSKEEVSKKRPEEKAAKKAEKEEPKMEAGDAATSKEEVSKKRPEEQAVKKAEKEEPKMEADAATPQSEVVSLLSDVLQEPGMSESFANLFPDSDDEEPDDPFDAIGKMTQAPRGQEDERSRRKVQEVDPDAYYRLKLADRDDWKDEYAPDSDDEEEEEEEEPVKRRRGADDQVDFSFLQRGEVEGKITVGIKEVAVRLGGRMILQDASWTVRTGEKLALVGANGCGKTTQLRVLLGQLTPEQGQVVKSPPNAKIAILEQSFVDDLNLENTLRQEILSAVPQQKAVMDEMEEVEKALEANPEDPDEMQTLVDRLQELSDQKDLLGVDKLEQTLDFVIEKVGFLPEDMDRKVGLFSGGWKVRIGMSKLFMMRPDVILLDEPTNHLDLNAVEWIEGFLKQQDLPFVIVTHDREFMNRVATRVVETVEGMTYSYDGNYASFMQQKETKMLNWRKKWELQEKKRKEIEAYIKANRGVQSNSQTRQRRIKELEALQKEGIDPPPSFVKRIKFRFPEPPKDRRGGGQTEILAEVRRISHGYGEEKDDEYQLLQDADFMVTPGDKIGIVGGNGKGKSTLLRILMGQEMPRDGGTVRPADVDMTGFFAQHQADLLPADKTGWEVVKEANEIQMVDEKLKEIMKKFRFRGDRMQVKVANLSGGEKARLAIVRMMLMPSRMLIFDEPTNHLDVPMKETLEYALREYEGAVVVVSHDRWFLSQTCKKIVEIQDGKVVHYDGDFRFYMDSNAEMRKKIESHYTGIDGLIDSVPASRDERKKLERKGLRKNRGKRAAEERQQLISGNFLSSREWR